MKLSLTVGLPTSTRRSLPLHPPPCRHHMDNTLLHNYTYLDITTGVGVARILSKLGQPLLTNRTQPGSMRDGVEGRSKTRRMHALSLRVESWSRTKSSGLETTPPLSSSDTNCIFLGCYTSTTSYSSLASPVNFPPNPPPTLQSPSPPSHLYPSHSPPPQQNSALSTYISICLLLSHSL